MKKLKTWLPLFPGFYSTVFEAETDYEIECINEHREEKNLSKIDYDDIEWNFEDYETSIVEVYTLTLQALLKDFVKSIEVEKIVRPKYYNFSNDSVDIIAEVNEKRIEQYLNDNRMEFATYLENHYTSYDGFMSSYSSHIEDWNIKDIITCEHKIGAVLQFIAENLIEDYNEFNWSILEENDTLPCAENYYKLIGE
jgi:hypothetical protein